MLICSTLVFIASAPNVKNLKSRHSQGVKSEITTKSLDYHHPETPQNQRLCSQNGIKICSAYGKLV